MSSNQANRDILPDHAVVANSIAYNSTDKEHQAVLIEISLQRVEDFYKSIPAHSETLRRAINNLRGFLQVTPLGFNQDDAETYSMLWSAIDHAAAPRITDEVGAELKEIEARANAATDGPWKVYKTPYVLTDKGREMKFKEDRGDVVVNAIGQAWDDPQLKGPLPIITTAHGPFYDPQHAVNIKNDDADFIAHARTDIPRLIAIIREIAGGK